MTDIERLREFAKAILNCWPGDADGLVIQEAAEEFGLFEKFQATEPCGDNCDCLAMGNIPGECFRCTELVKVQRPIAEGDIVTADSWNGMTQVISRIDSIPVWSARGRGLEDLAFFIDGGFWQLSQLRRVGK